MRTKNGQSAHQPGGFCLILGTAGEDVFVANELFASARISSHAPAITLHVPLQALKVHAMYSQLYVMYPRHQLNPTPFSKGPRKDHNNAR